MKKLVKLSDYVAETLKSHGVKYIFMITGGGAMHLNDSFGKTEGLTYFCNHHEQASAIAAECYARLTNNIGVCNVTTGPGGTNTLTGVIGAWLDSIPMLIISGQVKREVSMYSYPNLKLRQLGIQEIDTINLVKAVTKYAKAVMDPLEIRYELEKALYIAKSGRPGPVWLDIPLDVQAAMINVKNLRPFNQREVEKKPNLEYLKKQVTEVLNLIKKSKRPVIVGGFGLRLGNSVELFYKLIRKLNIPIVTSLSAHDLMWETHPLYGGRFGLYGTRGGNFAVQNSDLLLVLGCRLTLWETGYEFKTFAREATKIMVDIDKAELNKPTFKPDVPINFDVKLFINETLRQINNHTIPDFSWWLTKTKHWHKKYPNILPEYKNENKYVNSYYLIGELSDLMTKDDVIVTGNGTAFTCTCQSIKLKKGQRLCINIGCATMGYDLPAAIGAYLATNKKRVVLITGDGSVQMNLQELQTIVHHKMPIKIFILNNDGYLAIRITQSNYFKRVFGSDKRTGVSFPNMLKIAKAYGIPSLRIDNQTNLKAKLRKVLNSKGPIICEIMMPPNQPLFPKPQAIVKSDGTLILKPLEDMSPLLPRKEFLANMFIKPVNADI
ncbi:thiamine pyrophosphate-binding protein [Candidatus Roizmanbacteria bacterium]|nr:thiamine pyrophosphate-binding protein [Candidatus Roizmanbacteria bacterium]